MNPLPRKVSILAIASAVLCGFVLLGISGVTIWIRSASGTAFVLQKVKSLLAERAGISFEYSEISFDPLSHLSLKNLHVKTFGAGDKPFGIEQLDLTIPELDADYAVSLWTRKFKMTHFTMSHAQMEFRGHALPLIPGAKTGLELTKEFIQAPPVDVSISNASIEKFTGHIDYKMGNQEFDVQLNSADSHFGLKVQKENLETDGDLEVPESSISFVQKTENQKRVLKTGFLAKTNWNTKVHHEKTEWFLNEAPSKTQGEFLHLAFEQSAGDHRMNVTIPQIRLSGDAEILANTGSLEKTQIHGDVETSAVHFVQDGKSLQTGPQKMNLAVGLADGKAAPLKLEAHYSAGLSSPDFLFKPSQLHWDTHAEVTRDFKSIESESRAELSDAELFKLVFNVNQDVNEGTQGDGLKTVGLHLHSLIHVLSDARLSKIVKTARFLEKNGPFQTELAFDGHAKGKDISAIDQFEGVLDASVNDASGKFGKWITQTKIEASRSLDGSTLSFDEKGTTEIREVNRPTISASAPFFDLPFHISHQIQGSKDLIAAKAELEIPSITLGENGAGKSGKILDSLFSVTGRLQHGNILTLDDVSGQINRTMLKLVAGGSGKLKEKEFESHGSVVLQMQDGLPTIPGQSISGRIEFPWTLSIIHGHDIDFDGAVHLVDLAWSKDAYRVKGISGQVPISERLTWDGKKVQFSHLVHLNPFERVDFERIRPLIQSTDQVRIEQMGWEEKNYGPFLGFFAVDQNMLIAHQFDMNLGAGRVYGEMYFDAFPETLEFGILSRLTGINLSEVVPHRFLAKVPAGDDTISGRSGLVVKLTNGSIDGRVDITEIGSSQLVTFINILDPKFENEKMNRARSALGYGYPTLVGLSFDEGYMDMDLELSLLGISKTENIRGIAISPWISSATADVVSDLNSDPESKNKADQESVQ